MFEAGYCHSCSKKESMYGYGCVNKKCKRYYKLKPKRSRKMIPPIKIVCPECGGDGIERCNNPDHSFIDAVGGELQRLGCPVCGHDPDYKTGEKCPACDGIGQVYNYLTPEQWEAETGEKLNDDCPVWCVIGPSHVTLEEYSSCIKWNGVKIVARLGQPKPPEEYKP